MNIVQMIKAYGGMVFGKTDYWHPNMNYNKEASIDKINCYYVDMKAKHIYPES
jgi:heparosan-N-sulfate-glucuronate 5-epimerase